jgi:hypothetical protein
LSIADKFSAKIGKINLFRIIGTKQLYISLLQK